MKFLVSRADRFGARVLPLLNAIRLGCKLDIPVTCIWPKRDLMPPWNEFFEEEYDWRKIGIPEFELKNAMTPKISVVMKRLDCEVSFDEQTGYYFHTIPIMFEDGGAEYFHLDNPVGVYLLDDEEIAEVRNELMDIFQRLPFTGEIKEGIKEIDEGLRANNVERENSVSIHIRRGDAVDYAKKDVNALFERIVPINEYEKYIQEKIETGTFENVILASDDDRVKYEVKGIFPDTNIISLEDVVDTSDWSQTKTDIGDLYFLSRSSSIASGFTAFSIVSGLAGGVDIDRLDLKQDILLRMSEIVKENAEGKVGEEDGIDRLESIYSYSINRLIKQKSLTEAKELAERMREDLNKSPVPYNILGNISFINSEYKEAAKFHKLAIGIDSTNPHFHMALSHAQYNLSKLVESKKSAEDAFFLMPDNQNAIRQLIKINDIGKEYSKSLASLIYLEIAQNGAGRNIRDIRKRLELKKEEEYSEFELRCKEFLESNPNCNGNEFIDCVRNSLRDFGSTFSEEIRDKLDEIISIQPTRKFILSKLKENKDAERCLRFSTERFIQGRRALIGGLADRLKGAATVMLTSIALSRKFEIEWKHPEEIGNILVPNHYDWSVRKEDSNFGEKDLIDRNFSSEIRGIMLGGDIEKELEIDDSDYKIFCNSIDLGVSNNENYQLHDFDQIKGINRQKLVGTLLSLFEYRPGPEETMMMMVFLDRLRAYENSIAIHFRTGGDGDWRDPEMDDRGNVEVLIEKAKEICKDLKGGTCIYFACDSKDLKNQVIEKYGGELEIFSMNVPLAHIDRSDSNDAIMGSRFAIMENFMISCCDKILCGKGAFAELASNRRFVDPWRYY